MILDSAERAIMREMQLRGEASFSRVTFERLVQIGSTDVFNEAVDRLKAKGLVVEHRFSPAVSSEISLSVAGRSIKIDGAAWPK